MASSKFIVSVLIPQPPKHRRMYKRSFRNNIKAKGCGEVLQNIVYWT